MGIEPTYSAWKANVLPLNHTCMIVPDMGFEPISIMRLILSQVRLPISPIGLSSGNQIRTDNQQILNLFALPISTYHRTPEGSRTLML